MKEPESMLLLIGSAKPPGESTSEALGGYLALQLQTRGVNVTTLHVARVMRTEERIQQFLDVTDRVDLIVLAFPLYVDSLPYLVTAALERWADHRQAQIQPPPGSLLGIANCGFPEAHHNRTALAICRQFVDTVGLEWAGGLALGAGGAIHGQPLSEAGGMVRHIVQALDMTAEALAVGKPAPVEAAELMARPMMPSRLYTFMGDTGWRVQGWRNNVLRQLRDRPFAESN